MSASRRERLAVYRDSQRRYRPSAREFERLVSESLASLPREFRQRLQNVAVTVGEWPRGEVHPAQADGEGPLLGLYQGTPLRERGADYHLVPPDRITVYRGPILALCRTRAEVLREIRDTVVHEIGHYFGIPEDELP